MQGHPRHDLKTVFYKLLVLIKGGTLHHPVAAVCGVVKDRVANVRTVHPNLVGTARLELVFK